MEIANRELDGVLYLALHLAKQGLPTLFGERMVHEYIFRLYQGRPIVYFDQEQNFDINQRILNEGGLVFNLNSEGQNLDKHPGYLELFAKVSPTFTAMFVRGEKQRKHLAATFPEDHRDRVIATGHPSFDMLDSRFNAYHEDSDIVARHGRDYIQINTQFVAFNHKMGTENYLKMIAKLDEWKDLYSDEAFLKQTELRAEFEEAVAAEFLVMAREVAFAFPDRHVIVRPHPMEDRSYYEDALGGVPNLFIESDGPVRSWLSSASVLVHHSCTTGVEALLMGRNVIRFDPVESLVEKNMQSGAGMRAGTVDEVCELIRSGWMSSQERDRQIEKMKPYMANCGGALAAPVIAEYVSQKAAGGETWLPERLDLWERAKCWRKYLSKLLRARQPGRVGKKVRYALEKFPRLPSEQVRSRVARLRELEEGLPEIELEELGLNVFLIKPADSSCPPKR